MAVDEYDNAVDEQSQSPSRVKEILQILGSTSSISGLRQDGSSNDIRERVASVAAKLYEHFKPHAKLPVSPKHADDYSHVRPAPVDITKNTEHAYHFFHQHGWSEAQSAGIVANLVHESGCNPNAPRGDGGHAVGIAQWHSDRDEICKRELGYGLENANLDQQLTFVDWELKHSEHKAGDKLRLATDPRQAAAVVSTYFERPKDRIGNEIKRAETAAGLADRFAAADSHPPYKTALSSETPAESNSSAPASGVASRPAPGIA